MPLLYAKGYHTILMGSTVTIDIPYPHGTHPAIENRIRCAGVQVIHDGQEYNRVQKVATIGAICDEYSLPYPHLRTCWGHVNTGNNCYKCHKSLFTFLELSLEGYDPRKFGFNCTLEDILATTQQKLSEPIKSPCVTWHWQCIQQRANELMQTRQFDPKLQSFFQWIQSVDLEYGSMSNMSKRHAFYEQLWREGAALV